MPPLLLALAFAVAAAIAYPATALVLRRLTAARILDLPNARSSHAAPTPRGGGIALLAAIVPVLGVGAAMLGASSAAALLLAGILALAAVSFLDDLRSAPPAMRLAVQAGAVGLGLAALGDGLVFQGLLPFWLDRAVAAFAWLWLVNLYNFMDGIDGITSVETIAIGLGCALILGDPLAGLAAAALAGAAAGFLPWNRPRAKIFLGDVGSVPLGYLAGFALLSLAVEGHWLPALILPLYYLLDATATLVTRAARGERVWEAHRSHAYQKAAAVAGHAPTLAAIAWADLALVATALATAWLSPWLAALALPVAALLFVHLRRLARTPRAR